MKRHELKDGSVILVSRGVGMAGLGGTSLHLMLEEARIEPGAGEIDFTSYDLFMSDRSDYRPACQHGVSSMYYTLAFRAGGKVRYEASLATPSLL